MPHLTGLVVFTDLDGTLLDHDDYSWEAARPALMRLRENNIPLLAISSKTLAELRGLNARHHLFAGLIGENGGVIEIGSDLHQPGPATQTIDDARSAIEQAVSVPVSSFRSSAARQIADATGLSVEDAALAGNRNCSDPLIWQPTDNDITLAQNIAGEFGLKLVKGGRFHTLCGETDKGRAMQTAIAMLQDQQKLPAQRSDITSIALGDSPNDAGMLAQADIAVQIPAKHGPVPTLDLGGKSARLAPAPGPQGWNISINTILDDLSQTPTAITKAR
ncbi:mannosyl-3-phosphoglycerate phosphatase [Thalassospira sp. TSL5-1]|uniref:HAD-IIB family hydrolase n=1 Tax=Thalassospira sp. TSL5-1 TaxID=1544451 RepID=UPI00093AE616|nr:HAD-IIB family hydrolase [Thalassospira sp. TSL5-1]